MLVLTISICIVINVWQYALTPRTSNSLPTHQQSNIHVVYASPHVSPAPPPLTVLLASHTSTFTLIQINVIQIAHN
jgi:hypothetical protein